MLYRARQQYSQKFTVAVIIALIFNTLAAIVGTRIQEARIVALPLVLLWPVMATPAIGFVKHCRFKFSLEKILLLIFSLTAVWQVAFVLYRSTDVYAFDAAFGGYVFIMLSVLVVYALFVQKN